VVGSEVTVAVLVSHCQSTANKGHKRPMRLLLCLSLHDMYQNPEINNKNDKDQTLMSKASNGGSEAFKRFYIKYHPLLIKYLRSLRCNRTLAEDITHEVIIRFCQRKIRFESESAIQSYILHIAKNMFFNKRRMLSKEISASNQQLEEIPSRSLLGDLSNPESEVYKSELIQIVRKGLSQLTAEQRDAIRLIYLKELSHKQSADRLGCSTSALNNRLHRAEYHLRQILSDYGSF